jgi:prepilin-type processing-associated H-X9-DG protein
MKNKGNDEPVYLKGKEREENPINQTSGPEQHIPAGSSVGSHATSETAAHLYRMSLDEELANKIDSFISRISIIEKIDDVLEKSGDRSKMYVPTPEDVPRNETPYVGKRGGVFYYADKRGDIPPAQPMLPPEMDLNNMSPNVDNEKWEQFKLGMQTFTQNIPREHANGLGVLMVDGHVIGDPEEMVSYITTSDLLMLSSDLMKDTHMGFEQDFYNGEILGKEPEIAVCDGISRRMWDLVKDVYLNYTEGLPNFSVTRLSEGLGAEGRFRDGYLYYVKNPEALKARDLPTYNFMKDAVFQGLEYQPSSLRKDINVGEKPLGTFWTSPNKSTQTSLGEDNQIIKAIKYIKDKSNKVQLPQGQEAIARNPAPPEV